jgi:hypothetical protein
MVVRVLLEELLDLALNLVSLLEPLLPCHLRRRRARHHWAVGWSGRGHHSS